MNNKKDWKTLEEIDADLKASGKWDEYSEKGKQIEVERQRYWAEMEKIAAPIDEALHAAGVKVPSMFHLGGMPKLDSEAIPVLFEHLQRDYPDAIREIMLRALGRPQLLPHWDKLVDIFENNSANLSPKIRYVAAAALAEAANDTVIDDVIRMAKNQALGFDRAVLLMRLHRSKNPKAKMALMELSDDPVLGKEVKRMRRLARLGPLIKL